MFEQEKKKKKQRRIYDLLNAETKPKVSLSTEYKAKKSFCLKRAFFKEKEWWRIEQKTKKRLFKFSRYGD